MLKKTTEEAAQYFKDHGCELLDEYSGAMNKMRYKCECGRISHITWNNFTKGKRCGCSKYRKRYTIDEVRKILSEYDCKLLSNYVGGNTPIEYQCKCGKIRTKTFNYFLHSGKHCEQCAIKRGENHHSYKSYQYIYEYFQKQECELLTKDWTNKNIVSNMQLEYKCKCGRIATTIWNNFKKGKRCGYCNPRGRVKKFTLEEVKEIFLEAKCELLENHYVNVGTPMQFKCSCGNIDKIRLNNFKTGQRCHRCRVSKMSGESHFAWRHDRQQMELDKKFRSKCHRILSRCLKKVGKSKNAHTSDILGYSPKELQEHIINHPNWERVKNTNWHLDHIFPIEAFLRHNITDLKLINSLDNLQPITQRENTSKHAKYNETEFLNWLEHKKLN